MQLSLCFFFQAEDGVRDSSVTGVQTCALPISFAHTQTHTHTHTHTHTLHLCNETLDALATRLPCTHGNQMSLVTSHKFFRKSVCSKVLVCCISQKNKMDNSAELLML